MEYGESAAIVKKGNGAQVVRRGEEGKRRQEEEGKAKAERLGIGFVETSAKNNAFVEFAFFQLARLVIPLVSLVF